MKLKFIPEIKFKNINFFLIQVWGNKTLKIESFFYNLKVLSIYLRTLTGYRKNMCTKIKDIVFIWEI